METTKKRKTNMVGDDGLPLLPEIWSDIFTRLAIKSILRCVSVCKSWHSLVSNPNFISNYEGRGGDRVLVQVYDKIRARVRYSFTSHEEESFVKSREHDHDLPKRFRGQEDVQIVGSCNGLICLALFKKHSAVDFLIWNPTIRKIVDLPLPPGTVSYCYFGFGFDYKTSDYKVVLINKEDGVCEIFDLRKCSVWRVISPTINSWAITSGRAPECYFDGSVHWTGHRRSDDITRENIILAFNMSDEVFREITLPPDHRAEFAANEDEVGFSVETKVVASGGLICVLVFGWFDDCIDMLASCSVWAMKEYGVTESWSKFFGIDLPSAQVLPSTKLWPDEFFFRGNGEVLMTHDLEDEDHDYYKKQDLVLYNPESRKCKCLLSLTNYRCIRDLCFYKESIVLFDM